MPDLLDRVYCSEQIHIPPTFPYIMKLYCKAAIRTQPYDLLKWSAAYFRALANGEEPPVKERVEYPPYDSPSGLTPGFIKILINQFGKDPTTVITAQTLFKKWSDICLQEQLLIQLIALLGASTAVNWVRFVGVCAGFISKTLTQTMILICELFTEEPEGGMATVPYELFVDLYMFLAQMKCGPLTDEEKEAQDAIMVEESICHVAGKIIDGVYGEGDEEEFEVEEEQIESSLTTKEEVEEEKIEGEETSEKKGESFSVSEGERESSDEVASKISEYKTEEEDEGDDKQSGAGTILSEETISEESVKVPSSMGGEGGVLEDTVPVPEKEKDEEAKSQAIVEQEDEKKPEEKRMKLEDIEETIRLRIEEKLGEDDSYIEDEGKEFEDLTEYLAKTAEKVEKFTEEVIGFKIFKRYLRQDVPGIGPYVETDQVEKVVNFMDFWAGKQEGMVMPRNIRHWMCPPLDRVPTPEP